MMVCSVLLMSRVFAQPSEKGINYMNAYKEIAINEMMRTGVPASITIAQGMLESQYGESNLSVQSNNHFGIKCKTEWTGKKVYHDDDSKGECFRVYNTVAESYKDHSDFLATRPYYTSLFQLDPLDYEAWARGLKKCGYATETDYPLMLIKIINDYNLNQLSLIAMQKKNAGSTVQESTAAISKPDSIVNKSNTITSTVVENDIDTAEEAAIKKEIEAMSASKKTDSVKKKSEYPDSIFTINHTKVIYVHAGTALLSVANKYNISFERLLDFNDLEEQDILNADNLIFLEKKMKKGASDFHIVQTDETLYAICQKEGVRLDNIVEYNNLPKKSVVKTGQKILLRTALPNSTKTANIASTTGSTTNK